MKLTPQYNSALYELHGLNRTKRKDPQKKKIEELHFFSNLVPQME